MTTEQFIASLVQSLAWPGAVLGVAVLFRRQVGELLSSSLRRLKAGPFEFEFERIISSVEAGLSIQTGTGTTPDGSSLIDELAPVARSSPATAVLEAHSRLQHALSQLTDSVAGAEEPLGAVALARIALERKLITPETANAVEGVTTLRNLTAHGRQVEISVERAMDYLALVDSVLFAIRQGRRTE